MRFALEKYCGQDTEGMNWILDAWRVLAFFPVVVSVVELCVHPTADRIASVALCSFRVVRPRYRSGFVQEHPEACKGL